MVHPHVGWRRVAAVPGGIPGEVAEMASLWMTAQRSERSVVGVARVEEAARVAALADAFTRRAIAAVSPGPSRCPATSPPAPPSGPAASLFAEGVERLVVSRLQRVEPCGPEQEAVLPDRLVLPSTISVVPHASW